MPPDAHVNFAYSTVAVAPSPATTGTSLEVASGEGINFPGTPPYNVTVWPAGAQPTWANAEILRVTGIATDTLTVTREQEDTVARTIVVGDQIAATITAKNMTDAEDWTVVIAKSANQSVVDSTTYVNDTEFVIPVAAVNTVWWIELLLYLTSGTAGGTQFKSQFTFPASLGFYSYTAYNLAASAAINVNTGTRIASGATTGGPFETSGTSVIRAEMMLRTGGSAGDIRFQFANNAAGTGTATVFAGSLLRARQIF